MDTISHIILFTLVLLPPVYLQLLPFRNFISPYQKHFLYQGYSVVYIVETACLWFTVIHWDVSPTSWLSYKGFLSVGWIPYFLLNIYVIPNYLAQHIFILGMQTIYTICMHSIAINILLLLIPAEEFFLYLPIHFILYLILFCICLPIVYPFFTEIFSRFYTLNSEYLWKFICLLPLVLCINEAFFSMTIPPLSQKYVLPSLCLGIAGILIGVCVRTGLLQLEERIRLYKKNYALLVQL